MMIVLNSGACVAVVGDDDDGAYYWRICRCHAGGDDAYIAFMAGDDDSV